MEKPEPNAADRAMPPEHADLSLDTPLVDEYMATQMPIPHSIITPESMAHSQAVDAKRTRELFGPDFVREYQAKDYPDAQIRKINREWHGKKW